MPVIPYHDPAYIFRKYAPDECEDNGEGYPYIWTEISEIILAEKLYRCEDCGFAYLEDGDILTAHHNNFNKADCRKENLSVYCWLHHSADHESDVNMRDIRCKYCKGCFLGWPRLRRHIRGIHRPLELKIPEIVPGQRPTSYRSRGKALAAIQEQHRLLSLWRD